MTKINFKSKSILKNFKKALNASHHIIAGEQIYFTTGSLHKTIFPRNKHVHKYIDSIISEMMRNQIIQNNFSKKFLKEEIILILEQLELNNAIQMKKDEYNNLLNDLITKLENKIDNIIEKEFDEFEYIFHVENLKLDDEIKIGDVTLFPVNSEENYENFNNASLLKLFQENEVYAKTKVYGCKDYAHTKSQTKIKIVLNMMKLFLMDNECNFNLDGDVLYPNIDIIC